MEGKKSKFILNRTLISLMLSSRMMVLYTWCSRRVKVFLNSLLITTMLSIIRHNYDLLHDFSLPSVSLHLPEYIKTMPPRVSFNLIAVIIIIESETITNVLIRDGALIH